MKMSFYLHTSKNHAKRQDVTKKVGNMYNGCNYLALLIVITQGKQSHLGKSFFKTICKSNLN